MTKRTLNLIELILQAIACLLLFLPGMYYWEHWEKEFFGGYRLVVRLSISFFHAAGNTATFLGYLIAGLMFANVIILLFVIFGSSQMSKGKNIVHITIPFLTVALLILFSVIANAMDDYGYCAPVNSLFYFEMFLLLAVVVVSFMKCSQKIKEQPINVKVVSRDAESQADELKKFKELLDSGIITQEEFDAKKKQLLGL